MDFKKISNEELNLRLEKLARSERKLTHIILLHINEMKANEITKPQKDDTIRIEFTLTREQFEALKQAQSLLSHQCPNGSWSEVITQLAKKFNQSRMGKGNNNPTTEGSETAQSNTATKKPSMAPRTRYRSAITAKTKRYLLAKAHQACEYQDPRTGRRCLRPQNAALSKISTLPKPIYYSTPAKGLAPELL
ncbi:MAG: hypothetical protein IPM97_02655 [Bdellovibrionaceae bacterium]|nr:hypothetical protein [Pseudobdellovibrionaceae bacterium]